MSAVAVHHVADGPADAPVLLLSGSLGSTLAMWEPQLRALTDRFRVVRYDHRGHGGSPVPPGPYDIADLASDALALLDRLGVQRAHVCGLSLGGMVGQWLAIHAPGRVDRLAVLCSSARLGPESGYAERAALVRAEGTRAIAEAVVGRWLTPAYATAHPEVVGELRAMVAATPPEGYAACCEALAHMDLEPGLGRVRAPTLVVAGAQDPSLPAAHGEAIAARIPGARFALLDPAAHLASLERAEAVNELLLDHLAHPTPPPPQEAR
ncbi:MAG: 3-oxoadipate enol-lactonase [Solirubrobacteraceae bacterium]|jgi:3-oxoadipate enol-lactonase|nr:3-oxoadipate enol-lactonase [Solirubrobacteraceae bacterium]